MISLSYFLGGLLIGVTLGVLGMLAVIFWGGVMSDMGYVVMVMWLIILIHVWSVK